MRNAQIQAETRKTYHEVIAELKTQQNAHFESVFSVTALRYALFDSVNAVSAVILKYLTQHKEKAISLIQKNPKIADELREPFFGHLYKANEVVSAERVYNDFNEILSNPKPVLETVMQMHCIFEYRFFANLETDVNLLQIKEEMLKTLKPNKLFEEKERGRLNRENKAKATNYLGIAINPALTKLVGQSSTAHKRAVDQFKPDFNAEFVKTATELSLPIVAGRSGHTASLLSGAKIYGDLNHEQINEYAWACFVFLAAGGNHSFHEVMSIAALCGVEYKPGNYTAIPSALKTQHFFRALPPSFKQLSNVCFEN